MSRASDFTSRIMGYMPTVKEPVFLDFGSVMTRLVVKGKVVFHEPTCINIHKQTGSVIAIGKKALSLWGKTPAHIETVFPVEYGAVADQEVAEKYLQAVLQTVFKKEELFIVRLKGGASCNSTASPVEKEVMRNVLENVGMGGVKQIDKSKAFYCTLRSTSTGSHQIESQMTDLQHHSPLTSLCTLDIGGQTTEIGLFAGDQCIFSRTIPIGGISFTEIVKYRVRTQHQVAIGWATAESIKQQIGEVMTDFSIATSTTPTTSTTSVTPKNNTSSKSKSKPKPKFKTSKLAVRGKNVLDSIITTVTVSSSDFTEDFDNIMKELEEEIKISFSQAPADVVAEALSNGVYLTGGSSKIKGIGEYLQQSLKCDVIAARNPQTGVVKGLACLMQ